MINKTLFGTLADGQQVDRYTLTNNAGSSISVITYGATLQCFEIHAKALNKTIDIVTGFDDLQGYLEDAGYMGATVGRYANRIANGQFELNGQAVEVGRNLAGNCLHGGHDGFSQRVWQTIMINEGDEPSIQLGLISPDGDQGFPGRLQMAVAYTLTKDNSLKIEYSATSSADTVFNPTNHAYFNLSGHDSGDVFAQQIRVLADTYTPANETGIPTGECAPVKGTAFDLRDWSVIGDVLRNEQATLRDTSGLDHNFCVNHATVRQLKEVAGARDPKSGLSMRVFTDMPGMQMYTGNFIGDGTTGKGEARYAAHHGFCMETQFYPDTPNKANFPPCTLSPGETFQSVTEYRIEQ